MNIVCFGELTVGYKVKSPLKIRPIVNTSEKALKIFLSIYKKDESIALQEQFIVLYLNNANKLVGSLANFRGSTASCIVDFKIIIGTALKLNSTGIILSHNHPSADINNINPSQQDLTLTSKLKSALELMDIKLLDHLIISPDESYLSFADKGMMNN